jgi:hypothetical protein
MDAMDEVTVSDALARLVEDAEDLADIQASAAARAEMSGTGEAAIPWGEVGADLGLARPTSRHHVPAWRSESTLFDTRRGGLPRSGT